jgi:hypothetical protein
LTVREWRRRASRFSENTPSGGEKWRPRACPLLDEKEMIKIFVDTLKNPYFNRIVGLQLQFLVDLILVEERVKDAVKTKRMVDMPALMALVEQIAKRTLVEKNEGGVQDDSQERQEMVEDSSMLYSLGISQGWFR